MKTLQDILGEVQTVATDVQALIDAESQPVVEVVTEKILEVKSDGTESTFVPETDVPTASEITS